MFLSYTSTDLKAINVYRNLAWINELPADEAEKVFLRCCASRRWAERMANERPFKMLENLFVGAEAVWFSLPPADMIEAFMANREDRQNGNRVRRIEPEKNGPKNEITEAFRMYEEKFGFSFVNSDSGLPDDEIVALCRARMLNSLPVEIKIAAFEQKKIIKTRLSGLLEQ